MEREILFRGKRVDDGEWAEGSLVHRTLFYGEPSECYFIITGGEFHCDYYEAHKVDPATIGQYTGLTDKNGVKIFEGDIFCHPVKSKYKYIVEWDEQGGFTIFTDDSGFSPEKIEVIGNTHDNP